MIPSLNGSGPCVKRCGGRIVDVKELGDGSLLVSDNYAHAVYRITYQGPR